MNTVPLRNKLNPNSDLIEHLRIFSNNINEAFDHQWLPFDQIVGLLDIPFDPYQNPLFDVFIALQNIDSNFNRKTDNKGSFSISPYHVDLEEVAKFDLTFAFSEINGNLELYLNYDKGKFEVIHIETITEVLQTVFYVWVKQPTILLRDLNAFSATTVHDLIRIGSN